MDVRNARDVQQLHRQELGCLLGHDGGDEPEVDPRCSLRRDVGRVAAERRTPRTASWSCPGLPTR
jgi:hypothetical protein